jgi:formamidopyrimidine-DNA glycosylase
MPELPEVETSRRGIEPHILHSKVASVTIRDHRLRWPIPAQLPEKTEGRTVIEVNRRAKYIDLVLADKSGPAGHIIIHLGMSGSLRICDSETPAGKHDHIDILFDNGRLLRLRDPRRFGCVLWHEGELDQHKLITRLGPEPLQESFDTDYLYDSARGRRCSIKSHIMNSHIVVGVGNIYACESLFHAGINPKREAGRISKQRLDRLATAIKKTLAEAIGRGGTTLRDFTAEDGKPGYFAQQLNVYGRAGEACPSCGNRVKQITQQNRSTFYCPRCQR